MSKNKETINLDTLAVHIYETIESYAEYNDVTKDTVEKNSYYTSNKETIDSPISELGTTLSDKCNNINYSFELLEKSLENNQEKQGVKELQENITAAKNVIREIKSVALTTPKTEVTTKKATKVASAKDDFDKIVIENRQNKEKPKYIKISSQNQNQNSIPEKQSNKNQNTTQSKDKEKDTEAVKKEWAQTAPGVRTAKPRALQHNTPTQQQSNVAQTSKKSPKQKISEKLMAQAKKIGKQAKESSVGKTVAKAVNKVKDATRGR